MKWEEHGTECAGAVSDRVGVNIMWRKVRLSVTVLLQHISPQVSVKCWKGNCHLGFRSSWSYTINVFKMIFDELKKVGAVDRD